MIVLKLVPVLFILVHVYALQNPYCSLPCDFGGGRTYLHTVCERDNQKCGPDPSCGPDFREIEMTDQLRQYIVDLHNRLRNNVASGNETRDNQPSARSMMVMKYSKELEFIAQCWANTCHGNPLVHDVCRRTKQHEHVGQNLGFINSTDANFDYKETVRELIMYWYDEVADFKREWVLDTRDRGPNIKVGHYTQMIWADTDSIGCALSYYTTPNPNSATTVAPFEINGIVYIPARVNDKWHNLVLACNYSPGGNYIGAPIYDSGTPCTGCPLHQQCTEYPGLCGKSPKIANTIDNYSPFFTF